MALLKTFNGGVILCFCAVLLASHTQPLLAGEEIELELFRPQLGVSLQSIPRKYFEDIKGSYSSRSVSLDAALPLGKSVIRPSGGPLLSQLLLTAGFRVSEPKISFLPRDHTLYKGQLGLAGIIVKDAKNMFLVWGGAGFSEDDQTRDDSHVRFSGLGFGSYKTSDSLSLFYGLGFSYLFGRGALFPILGLRWKPSRDWSVTTILPFYVRAARRLDSKTEVGFSLGVMGDRIRFANEGAFAGRPDTLNLKIVQGRLGSDITYRLSDSWSFRAEAGILSGRTLALASGNDNFLTSPIKSSGYLNLGIRFTFGESIFGSQ